MRDLAIGSTELRLAALITGSALLAFLLLSKVAGWPNATDGWPFAVGVSLALGLLPVASDALAFLREARGKVAAAGITLDFSAAVPAATASAGQLVLPGNILRHGMRIDDSGSQELDRIAAEAAAQGDLVIDLGSGNAWYATRLFAVAATMQLLGRAARLVLVGQRGGETGQFLGWIAASDVVAAMERADSRYGWARRRTEAYLAQLRVQAMTAAPSNLTLPRYGEFEWRHRQIGDAVAMRILVDQMRVPDVVQPPETPNPGNMLEPEDNPPWLSPKQALALLDAWLINEKVEMTQPQRAQILAILDSRHDIIASVRDGRFQGFVEVRRAERAILRQLAERAA